MKLRAPGPKPIRIAAVRPNEGVKADYRKRLLALVEAMHKDVLRAVTRAWAANPPYALLAKDASPAAAERAVTKALARKWGKIFKDAAEKIAAHFADEVLKHNDFALKRTLRDAGFSVKFQMTRPMNDAYQAIRHENVGLIKSIPSQHLADVEGLVMRSVQHGRSLGDLTKDLQERFAVTKNRAALISRDQNNKATAVMNKVRKLDLGIEKSKWVHTLASKHPRESHEDMNGTLFDTAEGCFDKEYGDFVQPGELINCLPGDSVIEFAAGCQKLWRRWYSGELTQLIMASGKTLHATPNHPVLTGHGWVPIHTVNLGEDVITVPDQIINGLEVNINSGITKFSDLFETISSYITPSNTPVSHFEFHGDISNNEVDVVNIDSFLPNEIDSLAAKALCELIFTRAEEILGGIHLPSDRILATACRRLFGAPEGIVRGFSTLLPLLKGHALHADEIGLRAVADLGAMLQKAAADHISADLIPLGQLKFANAGFVIGDDQIIGELFNMLSRASACWNGNTPSADELGNSLGAKSDLSGNLQDGNPLAYQRDRVINKRGIDFLGHVFNLQSVGNWYSSNTYIIHNCGCVAEGIIPGMDDETENNDAEVSA